MWGISQMQLVAMPWAKCYKKYELSISVPTPSMYLIIDNERAQSVPNPLNLAAWWEKGYHIAKMVALSLHAQWLVFENLSP